MNNPHLLFIDNDPKILEGQRRMLRGMRQVWTLHFACNSREALAVLARHPVDVVVADMGLPCDNGAHLLETIRERFPQVGRIVLSSYHDEQGVLRALEVAHQYLAKPCCPDTLKASLQRALNLRHLLGVDSPMRPLATRLHFLPSLPSLYREINQALQDSNTTLRQVGQIVARDPAMTAKVLQLTNSAFFGLNRRVTSPEQAVSLLGLEMMQTLVLSAQVFAQFEQPVEGFDLEALWAHSVAVGRLAKQLAKAAGCDENLANDAMVAGVLHDIGKLILLVNLPQDYVAVIEQAQGGARSPHEVERERFGVSHAEVGGYLLGLWGLPDAIVEAVAFHHTAPASILSTSAVGITPLTLVYVADALVEHQVEADARAETDAAPQTESEAETYTGPLPPGLQPADFGPLVDQVDHWLTLFRSLPPEVDPA